MTIEQLEEKKQELLKKVGPLVAKKKRLYSNMDISSPKSDDEKKLDKEVRDIFSELNDIVLQKRKLMEKPTASKGGLLVGKSHKQGGINIVIPEGKIEAEWDEIILTKGVYQSNETVAGIIDPSMTKREAASALNESEGGVKIAEQGTKIQNINNKTAEYGLKITNMENLYLYYLGIGRIFTEISGNKKWEIKSHTPRGINVCEYSALVPNDTTHFVFFDQIVGNVVGKKVFIDDLPFENDRDRALLQSDVSKIRDQFKIIDLENEIKCIKQSHEDTMAGVNVLSKGGKIKTHAQFKSLVLETVGENNYLRTPEGDFKLTDSQLNELISNMDEKDMNPYTAAKYLMNVNKNKYQKITAEGVNSSDLTLEKIDTALKSDFWLNNPEAEKTINEAVKLGYVLRTSHTQAEWTEEGIFAMSKQVELRFKKHSDVLRTENGQSEIDFFKKGEGIFGNTTGKHNDQYVVYQKREHSLVTYYVPANVVEVIETKASQGAKVEDYTKTLVLVDVIFDEPEYNYSTNMAGHVTEKEARDYFVGKTFNVASYPNEVMKKVIDIKFHPKGTYEEGGKIESEFEKALNESKKVMDGEGENSKLNMKERDEKATSIMRKVTLSDYRDTSKKYDKKGNIVSVDKDKNASKFFIDQIKYIRAERK